MSAKPVEQAETAAVEKDVEDEEVEMAEDDDDAGQGDSAGAMTASLLQNPSVLAAIQGKLGQMVGQTSGYIETLPKIVKRRIKALKKLQGDVVQSETKFYEEVHELECKYASAYAALFERRRDILSGAIEPTDSDCEWPSDEEEEEDEDEKLAEVKEKAKIEEDKEESKEDEDVKGIPGFWLTIFRNVDMLSEMTQEHDEPIIKCLNDIKVEFQGAPSPGFTLHFIFGENDYLTDSVLTKHYDLRIEPDDKDPLAYEGPEIIKCQGCTVNWKAGKNVTVKTVKKKQKHKNRGTVRTVTKTVPNDSFFNFFSPPEAPEEGEEEDDDETESLLAADFEIGHFLRERVVPRAVLYFTGEALEDDDEEDDEYDEDEDAEDGDDDDDEENDADYNPGTDGAKPADCKSQ